MKKLVVVITIAVAIAGVVFSTNKSAELKIYNPLDYEAGQQAECVISDIQARQDSSKKAMFDITKAKASVNFVNYSEKSDFTENISKEDILSDVAAFNHYGKTYFKFGNSRSYGKNNDKLKTYVEASWGMNIQTDGSKIKCTPYNHTSDDITVKSIEFWSYGKEPRSLTKVPDGAWDKTICFDMSKCEDGIYLVRLYITGENVVLDSIDSELLYMNSTAYTCCSVNQNEGSPEEVSGRLRVLHKWTSPLNPGDYLSLEGLTYPSSGEAGVVNNVKDIAKFSHTLIEDEWTDAYKVYVFTDWFINNVAYDMWRYKINDGHSRAYSFKNYSNPKNFMWANHVGVCWDYTNALAIMCRENGIPATSIDTDTHTWNLVYIDGEWESIDLCGINKYDSYEKVPDRNKWMEEIHTYWTEYAVLPGSAIYEVTSIGEQMWTYEKAYGK